MLNNILFNQETSVESKLICGNWEKVFAGMEEESVNLIYTDPPYGMGYKSNIPGSKPWKKSEGPSENKFTEIIDGDTKDGVNWDLLATECFRILKNDSYLFLHGNVEHVVLQHACKFVQAGFNLKGLIPWRKKFAVGGDVRGAMKRDWEPILYFAKGKPKLRCIEVIRKGKLEERDRISEIEDWTFQLKKSEKIGFQTQKPIALCKQIISLASDKDDIVCDPFGGSFTIAKAAKDLERKYFSAELNEDVYNKYRTRVEPENIV